MNDKMSRQHSKANKEYILPVLIAMAIVIVLLIAVIVILLNQEKEEEPKRNVVITHDNVEEMTDEMLNQEYIPPGYYSTKMSIIWHFTTGDAISEDAYVENNIENTNDIYFDVFLADDEDIPILRSPVIPRGAQLDNIALDTPLKAGIYDCVMVYHLVDEKQNSISTLRVGFEIVVEQ